MPLFQLILGLLFIGAMLSALARKLTLPYPALLALAGAALALIPGTPAVALDPRLTLALFVSPVLLDAAFDSSPRDLRYYWRPVVALAIGAVIATVVSVAVVVRWLIPDMPWAVAIALGAIVAPPDAAAATAVLRQLRLPHRLLVILEGESLFNDATALLIYRAAVAAAVTGTFNAGRAIPTLAAATVGSVVLAFVLSRLVLLGMRKISDVATSVILQFLSTFAVWMLADDLGLSGIITVVVYAILLARRAPAEIPARLRIPSYAVWEVVVFVLNVLAFILVGLQLRPILDRLNHASLVLDAVTAAAVCVVVIVVRLVWVAGYSFVARWIGQSKADSPNPWERPPTWRGSALVGWSGMRGIVTLAAALALPSGENGVVFPRHDLVILIAFAVVFGTLVVQGLTLRPLIGALALDDDGAVEREVWIARAGTARAGLQALSSGTDAECDAPLCSEYELRARHAERAVGAGANDPGDEAIVRRLVAERRRAQEAERRTLVALRDTGAIGDDAFHRVEEELDWADLNLDGIERRE